MFHEMAVSPDDPQAEARIVRQTVDQIVHADRHGFDYVWLSEHHFLQGFSHMSAPEVIFGAAAYQTQHIRFGFGLALTPPAYNHPVRVAEKVAM
ncbi:LLM class flavin-dependent oxidoreductase, partial [Mycobacterium tuberculosis]|nr:LLM class flavin-dependent oxidoreductase [Mycobacterium tuberculosis]